MDEFILYGTLGLNHVLDLSAYDHLLFLIVLAVIFKFSQWKKVLWMITFFTLGHSITLGLASYGVLKQKCRNDSQTQPIVTLNSAPSLSRRVFGLCSWMQYGASWL